MTKTYTSPSDLGLPPVILHKCSTCKQPMECYHVLMYRPDASHLEGLSRCNNIKCRDTGWYQQIRLRFKNNEVAYENKPKVVVKPSLFGGTKKPSLFGGI